MRFLKELHTRPERRIRTAIAAAALVMVVGHLVILNSAAGTDYSIYKTWVSRFAATPGYGWIIKLSIGLFCIALVDLCRMTIRWTRPLRHRHALKLAWMTLATMLIGGLCLVAMYDMYVEPERGVWSRTVKWATDLWSGPSDQEIEGVHHSVGFLLFVLGFGLYAALLAITEWSVGRPAMLPTSIFLIIIAAALVAWLMVMRSQDSLVGIPQRVLLVVVAVWVVRAAATMRKPL